MPAPRRITAPARSPLLRSSSASEAVDIAADGSQAPAAGWGRYVAAVAYELNALGRHLEALAILEQALAAYRERGEARTIRIARWMVAHTQRLLGRHAEALEVQLALERELAAAGETDPYVLEEIAALYEALGEPQKARAYSERLAALKPGGT